MKKILAAGLVGGLVVFLWGFVSHMLLPVGEMGLRSMPVNSPLLESMKANLAEEGLYMFPGREEGQALTEAEEAVWATKYRMGPTGLLLYHPAGRDTVSPKLLGIEFATDVAGASLLAYLLIAITGSSGAQVRLAKQLRVAVAAGVFAWASISVPHWNWYGFPCPFILAELIDQVVGWTLAVLAISFLWRRSERRAILQAERIWES
jgi:hypothetical protein